LQTRDHSIAMTRRNSHARPARRPLTLAVSPVAADDAAKLAANKKTVLEFYATGLNRKDFDAALRQKSCLPELPAGAAFFGGSDLILEMIFSDHLEIDLTETAP
jgi:hypothetical protein